MGKAYIVVGLGYGDEGKGTMVDYLAREHEAGLVVRYNGGPQAAHNVALSDGRHHTFAQFGSASFIPGVYTYLSQHMLVEPYALLNEKEVFRAEISWDPLDFLYIDGEATIITPWHWLLNRLREHTRATRQGQRHGSCGMGIGETRAMQERGITLKFRDLFNAQQTLNTLSVIKDRAISEAMHLDRNSQYFDLLLTESTSGSACFYEAFYHDMISRRIKATKLFEKFKGTVIFEGAQGMLIDEKHGFCPYNTWTDVTPANALSIIKDIAEDEIRESIETKVVGVTRSYMTRHGPGPFPSECFNIDINDKLEHNKQGEWQGSFRLGYIDYVALHYSLMKAAPVHEIAITHMDETSPYYVNQYYNKDGRVNFMPYQPTAETLYQYEGVVEQRKEINLVENFTKLIGIRPTYLSFGPTEKDKVIHDKKGE